MYEARKKNQTRKNIKQGRYMKQEGDTKRKRDIAQT
jgi:hypothetical protein